MFNLLKRVFGIPSKKSPVRVESDEKRYFVDLAHQGKVWRIEAFGLSSLILNISVLALKWSDAEHRAAEKCATYSELKKHLLKKCVEIKKIKG